MLWIGSDVSIIKVAVFPIEGFGRIVATLVTTTQDDASVATVVSI
jgi:hypothetical protein